MATSCTQFPWNATKVGDGGTPTEVFATIGGGQGTFPARR